MTSDERRQEARSKVNKAIAAVVKDEKDSEAAEVIENALGGVADVCFGIWRALDRIANK